VPNWRRFPLIEVLIVIAVILIVASVVLIIVRK
jgi:Tfp pilus assembly major pilin PilA